MPVMHSQNQDSQELLMRCYSLPEWCKTVYPEDFSIPFSPGHYRVMEAMDDDRINQLLILANRRFGKTSIVNRAFPAKRICFMDNNFIVPISFSATKAEDDSENLKFDLTTNNFIREFFPPLKSENWSRDSYTTSTGIRVLPRGRGQQVRGLLYRGKRPDLFVLDDIEDDEEVANEERRRKTKEWFFSNVHGCVDRSHKNWRIIVIGTLLHEDSLLANLAEDPNWHTIRLELCDDNYKSNWPEFMSDEDVRKLADEFRQQGLLDVFYREYRNIPISLETASFTQAMFHEYDEASEKLDTDPDVESIVICDPAKTVTPQSDDSAIVGISYNRKKNKIYFRDCVNGKMFPDQVYEEVFAMAKRLRARVIGLEVTSLNEFITQPFLNEMARRGLGYEIVELKARAKKEDRIKALMPYYRKGLVYHNKNISGPLEAQLLSFPRSKKWDVMDATAYMVEMFELGNRYFMPPESNEEEDEKIYKTLLEEEEDLPELEWRIA